MSRSAFSLTVNGEQHELLVEPHWTLLQVLRTHLGLPPDLAGIPAMEVGGLPYDDAVRLLGHAAERPVAAANGPADRSRDEWVPAGAVGTR